MKKLSRTQLARRLSLGFFLVLVTALTILHMRVAGFPSIDGLCPFGGVETLYAYLAGGQLLQNIQPGNIVLLVAITVLAIVLSRFSAAGSARWEPCRASSVGWEHAFSGDGSTCRPSSTASCAT